MVRGVEKAGSASSEPRSLGAWAGCGGRVNRDVLNYIESLPLDAIKKEFLKRYLADSKLRRWATSHQLESIRRVEAWAMTIEYRARGLSLSRVREMIEEKLKLKINVVTIWKWSKGLLTPRITIFLKRKEDEEIRKRGKIDRKSRITAYRATYLLKMLTGYGPEYIRRKIYRLYGINVSLNTLRNWLYRNKKPWYKLCTFEKSLFYPLAYKMTLELKKKYPEWNYYEIALAINRSLPVHIPHVTIKNWIERGQKPQVTPLKLTRETLPDIAYCLGVGHGDYRRSHGGLAANDRDFVEHYAMRYEKVTGVRVKLKLDKRGQWYTHEGGGWLKSMLKTDVWKVIADLDPVNWLRGLYDSGGYVSPIIRHKEQVLNNIWIGLSIGNFEVKEFAKKLLKKLGFNTYETYNEGGKRAINGVVRTFSGCWQLRIEGWKQAKRFTELIGFRESKRKEKLRDLLSLEPLPRRKRYEKWILIYEKKPNGRWEKRSPPPPILPCISYHLH